MTKVVTWFAISLAFLLISCVPKGIIYTNPNYGHIKEPKAIYLCPLQPLTFDDTAKAFAKYFSKQKDTSFETYGSLKCSYNYKRLGNLILTIQKNAAPQRQAPSWGYKNKIFQWLEIKQYLL